MAKRLSMRFLNQGCCIIGTQTVPKEGYIGPNNDVPIETQILEKGAHTDNEGCEITTQVVYKGAYAKNIKCTIKKRIYVKCTKADCPRMEDVDTTVEETVENGEAPPKVLIQNFFF